MALAVAAVGVSLLGGLLLTVFRPLSAAFLITASVVLGFAVVAAVAAAYLFRVVSRGEQELHRQGVSVPVNRSLTGSVERAFRTSADPDSALDAAFRILQDPRWELIHVRRGRWSGVTAIRPAEAGLVIVYVVPLAIRVRAKRRPDGTIVSVTVVQSSVRGWPPLTGWIVWSSMRSWVGLSQEIADTLSAQLARQLNGSPSSPPRAPVGA